MNVDHPSPELDELYALQAEVRTLRHAASELEKKRSKMYSEIHEVYGQLASLITNPRDPFGSRNLEYFDDHLPAINKARAEKGGLCALTPFNLLRDIKDKREEYGLMQATCQRAESALRDPRSRLEKVVKDLLR